MFKSGFVNIIGNPNVGKSTLMNLLVGEKISIVTSKSQTTRQRILGIVNGDGFQIIYSDSPGIIEPKYKLQERMMNCVQDSFEDADIFLYVTDLIESPEKNIEYIEKLQMKNVPTICIINKIDLADEEKIQKAEEFWREKLPLAEIIKVSALKNINCDKIPERIKELLPENSAWFNENQLTDKSDRFIVCEIIREKILENYQKEIPYACEVICEEFKETETIIKIKTLIFVERETQKGIIIGSKGLLLKKTASEARIDMEKFYGKKVFLETFVKVKKDWRSNEKILNSFGYL